MGHLGALELELPWSGISSLCLLQLLRFNFSSAIASGLPYWVDHLAAGVKAVSSISLGPAVGPGCLKVVDQVGRQESFLSKVSGLANTSQRVAGAKHSQLAQASNYLWCLLLGVEHHLGGVSVAEGELDGLDVAQLLVGRVD